MRARQVGFWLLRRLVLVPVVIGLAVLSGPLWLLVVALSPLICLPLALAHRDWPRWRAARLVTMAVAYLLGEVAVIIAALVLWLVSGCGWRHDNDWFVRAHRWLLRKLLGFLVALARPVLGFWIEVQEPVRHPDDLSAVSDDRPLLVLARHAGPGASFALVHLLLSTYGRRVHVVLKDTLRLDPALDLLLSRTGCTWVTSPAKGRLAQPGGSSKANAAADGHGSRSEACPTAQRSSGRDEAVTEVRDAAQHLRGKDVLLLFPEGADWTPLRHLAAVRRLHGRGLREQARAAVAMPHVLPPRPRGTVAALLGAPDTDVLVFTHTGHDELLDPAAAWAALPLRRPLQMAWWRAPARSLPIVDEPTVTAWLQQTWQNIDAWIDEQQALRAALDDTRSRPGGPT